MNLGILSKEIEIKPLAYLHSNEELLASTILLVFMISPLIEMIYCLFNSTERLVPLVFYSYLIPRFIFPICSCLFLFIVSSWIYSNSIYRLFLFLIGWMILSALVTGTIGSLFYGNGYRMESLAFVISYFLVFLFSATRVKDPNKKELLALISVIVSIVLAIYSFTVHELCLNGIIPGDKVNVAGVFSNINHYGYYLCIHIMLGGGLFALSKRRALRIIGMIGLVVNTVVLALNNSFGPWLACICAFLFLIIVMAIVKHRLDIMSVIAFVTFLAVSALMGLWTNNIFASLMQFLFDVKSVSDDPESAAFAGSGRWALWVFTAEKIAQRPIFGWGNEGITSAMIEATGNSRPHNEILQYAAFYGIPAAVLYVIGFMSIYVRGYKNRANLDNASIICLTGAFAYLVSSLFGNTMYYTAPFFFIFLGLGYYNGSDEIVK